MTYSVTTPMLIGAGAYQAGLLITIGEVAFWDGYDLTTPNTTTIDNGVADHINLLTGAATPLTTATPATVYWTLSGSPNGTPSVGDAGLDNHLGSLGNGAGNKYVLNSIASSGGGTATYVPDISYVTPITLTGYGTKNGLFAIGTVANSTGLPTPITSIPTSPTVFVDGVSQTGVYGPVWADTTADLPVVAYSFGFGLGQFGRGDFGLSPIDASNVLTYSVPFGGITTSAGLCGQITSASAANYFGTLEDPFGGATDFVPDPKMSLGVNVGYANMVNYFGYSLTRNARYRFPYEASTWNPDTFEWLTVPVNQTVSCPYFNLAAGSGIDQLAGNPAPIGAHSIVYDDVDAGIAGTFYTAPTGSARRAWLGSVQTATAIGIDTSASGPAGGLGNVALSQTATLTNGSPNVTLSAPSATSKG